MAEKIVTRREAIKELKDSPEVKRVLLLETHHKHEIVRGSDGRLRWKQNEKINKLIDEKIDLNYLWQLMYELGLNKNSELVRKLYREMGYSLFGYWEVFYWEVNNEIASEYEPNKNP